MPGCKLQDAPTLLSVLQQVYAPSKIAPTMPLGPRVDLTRSLMAMAPTKEACRQQHTWVPISSSEHNLEHCCGCTQSVQLQ